MPDIAFDIRPILALSPTLASQMSEIKKLETKLASDWQIYKETVNKNVDQVLEFLKGFGKGSERWQTWRYYNIGTTMDFINYDTALLLGLDGRSPVHSPSEIKYLACCLVAALWSTDSIAYYARIRPDDVLEIRPILEEIAQALNLKIEFFERDEKFKDKEWKSLNATFSKTV